ncbi:hypothetical protein BN946_scf184989.g44 [Trametes cinnabarina]|uniref:Profilin n=1 Tax=Pycnoporus cinnabarinus TaxID=5643 RepID=A0A060S8S8_PYCCI|nr:hypothetical protein BN946_scf184989.g44 [Trametes cinnabarina]
MLKINASGIAQRTSTPISSALARSQRLPSSVSLEAYGPRRQATRYARLSDAECKAITDAFNSPAMHLDTIRTSGIRLAGQKFFTINADERHIYGKKAADGCIIVKTKQAVLVAEYTAPVQAPESTPIVENLADYLVSVGY